MAELAAPQVWHTALGQLQLHVTRPNYDTWLKDTVGLRTNDGHFVVGAPTEFVKEWLATRMRGLVTQTVGTILGRPVEVSFEIIGGDGNGSNGNGHGKLPWTASPSLATISSPSAGHRLNPNYTFANFIVGSSNRLAAAAALAAAERPGQDYNPLFIYSAPGLGKTHLLHAIASHAGSLKRQPLYITSEQFTNQFINSIAQGRSDEFRRRYRSAEILLIDDIQFLAGKDRTQEEFFYTFNDLHANGCQVVLTADRPPAAINGLEARLASRFGWGLIADMQSPEQELRLAIVQSKAKQQAIKVGAEVAAFLVDRVRDNIRELEGALNRVLAYGRLISASSITMDVASRALAALRPAPATPPDPAKVLKTVCTYFGVSLQSITGKTRARPVAEARHVAMYLLREDSQLALKQVGLLVGHRDHSTVIHGVQKVARGIAADANLSQQISELRTLIAS